MHAYIHSCIHRCALCMHTWRSVYNYMYASIGLYMTFDLYYLCFDLYHAWSTHQLVDMYTWLALCLLVQVSHCLYHCLCVVWHILWHLPVLWSLPVSWVRSWNRWRVSPASWFWDDGNQVPEAFHPVPCSNDLWTWTCVRSVRVCVICVLYYLMIRMLYHCTRINQSCSLFVFWF